ncbi:hypothetical protein Scep_002349 [Stephania cephalantha]|uniref:Uncharacterized protein n=1 Tax=Stephania cephalantha TaxID=152367 RepID=A0AAP0L9V0_9MAGN
MLNHSSLNQMSRANSSFGKENKLLARCVVFVDVVPRSSSSGLVEAMPRIL